MEEHKHCNLCGKPLDEWDKSQDFTIHKKVGYGSSYDLCEIHLQLCCECFDRLVDGCEVNPVVREYE